MSETNFMRTYASPAILTLNGKAFSMSSPANFFKALNVCRLSFDAYARVKWGDNFCCVTGVHVPYRYARKRIWAPKFSSTKLYRDVRLQIAKDKRAKSKCQFCNKEYVKAAASHKGSCGDVDCVQRMTKKISHAISSTHWCKSQNKDVINLQRIETRKKLDDLYQRTYVPWNKGKRGIYSPETRAKISAATRLQFQNEQFKKTSIEVKVDNLFKEMGIRYKYSFFVANRQYDFCLIDCHTLVEVQGDFWHANPRMWADNDFDKLPLREHQKMKIIDDKSKARIASENGYRLMCVWEYDIHNDWEGVVKLFDGIQSVKHD